MFARPVSASNKHRDLLQRLEPRQGRQSTVEHWRIQRADEDKDFAKTYAPPRFDTRCVPSSGLRPMPPAARSAPPHVARLAVIRQGMHEEEEDRRAELEELSRAAEERVKSVRKAREGDIGKRNQERREMNEVARIRTTQALDSHVAQLQANSRRRAKQLSSFLERQWEEQARPESWVPASTLYAPITSVSPRAHRRAPRRKATKPSADDGAPPPQEDKVESCVLCSGRLACHYIVPDPDKARRGHGPTVEGLDRAAYVAELGLMRAELTMEDESEELRLAAKDDELSAEEKAQLERKASAIAQRGARQLMRWCLERARAMNIHEADRVASKRLCRACSAHFPSLLVLRGAGYRAGFLLTQLSGVVDSSDLLEGIEFVEGMFCPAGHALVVYTERPRVSEYRRATGGKPRTSLAFASCRDERLKSSSARGPRPAPVMSGDKPIASPSKSPKPVSAAALGFSHRPAPPIRLLRESCDLCGGGILPGRPRGSCRACDYVVCAKCTKLDVHEMWCDSEG